MTFRERMESDFAAMKANDGSRDAKFMAVIRHMEEAQANEPRPMPDDWAPEFDVQDGNMCRAYVRRREEPNPGEIALGCVLTNDDRQANGKAIRQLFQSVWQGLELLRLGRFDELKSMGFMK